MKEAIEHYEAALKSAFPEGATGEVFNHWNEARKALAQTQGEWVDLTEADIWECCERDYHIEDFARAVIAKFKEKNTPPIVPQGEPVAWVAEGKERVGFGREEIRKFVVFDQTLPVGTAFYTTPPSSQLADAAVEAAIAELQHKYDELLEHYTWQGNQYMEAMRKKSAEIEAAIETTKEKAAKIADAELMNTNMLTSLPPKSSAAWNIAAAIRSMK